MQFEWDPDKARENAEKHGVSFEDAVSVFGDPLATTVSDPDHSVGEVRYLTTGMTQGGQILIIWHTEREDTLRIIGAREATAAERRIYESGE